MNSVQLACVEMLTPLGNHSDYSHYMIQAQCGIQARSAIGQQEEEGETEPDGKGREPPCQSRDPLGCPPRSHVSPMCSPSCCWLLIDGPSPCDGPYAGPCRCRERVADMKKPLADNDGLLNCK